MFSSGPEQSRAGSAKYDDGHRNKFCLSQSGWAPKFFYGSRQETLFLVTEVVTNAGGRSSRLVKDGDRPFGVDTHTSCAKDRTEKLSWPLMAHHGLLLDV